MTDAHGFNEMFFDSNENSLDYFKSRGYNLCAMARTNQEGPKNWSYRTDTYGDNEYMFFRCTDSIPSFEVSMGLDKSGKLKVHNIVPLDRDQIDAQQYNVLLDKFRKAIIDPYNQLAPSIFRLPIDGESNTELDGESNTEPNADEIAFEFFNDDLVAVKKSAISTLELITDGRQITFDRKEDTDFDFSYNIREYKIVLDVGDPSKFRMLSGKCDPIVRLMGKRDMTRIIIGKDSYGTVWPTNDDGEVTADQNPYQHDSKNGSELVLTFNSTELIC